jgi:hypothetical protein
MTQRTAGHSQSDYDHWLDLRRLFLPPVELSRSYESANHILFYRPFEKEKA